ncbi:MAG: type II toxin-antitoxin system RelE/ParE family toxin [Rhodocyclaceae bacterium]|nr:type II toxin-antitoxin system RelE/ParE family toxin [Rhodocyclaceae bacterium]
MAALRYTDSAENDLLEAWLFIAEDNPQAADQVVDTIDREARHLLDHPRMGRERPELAPGLRSWPTTTPYILFYLVDEAGVVVARILHHARDVGAIADWPGR